MHLDLQQITADNKVGIDMSLVILKELRKIIIILDLYDFITTRPTR